MKEQNCLLSPETMPYFAMINSLYLHTAHSWLKTQGESFQTLSNLARSLHAVLSFPDNPQRVCIWQAPLLLPFIDIISYFRCWLAHSQGPAMLGAALMRRMMLSSPWNIAA